jgi:hypothetical protein
MRSQAGRHDSLERTQHDEREAADGGQRSRLVSIFEQLEAEALLDDTIRVVAVPREAWRPFFAGLVLEHHTFACSNLDNARTTLAEIAKAAGWGATG